jgi:uncharacterized LabA/DUF88 family protein
MSNISSIGLFIDGQYYYRLDKDLVNQKSRRVKLKGLIDFIEKTIAAKYKLERESCVVTEAHFFRGRLKANDAKDIKGGLLEERKFEDRLIENDVILHYKHVYYLPDGSPHEKGIDVWFALETFELALYRDFDFIVMITGDADYEMLARKIKSLKKPAILLSWHYDEQDPTAKDLKDEISFQINIINLLISNPGLLNSITEAASS